MYLFEEYGELIYYLRKKKHLTQEQLSEKMDCATATVSNLENNCRGNRESTLKTALDCLGEPGFFSSFYFEKEKLSFLKYQCDAIEYCEYNDLSKLETLLLNPKKFDKEESVSEKQFLELLVLLYYKRINKDTKVSVNRLSELLKLSIKDFVIGEIPETTAFNYVEILIINNIAISLIKEMEYTLACKLLRSAIYSLVCSIFFLPRLNKTKAALYNNLAVCECNMNSYSRAVAAADKALRLVSYEGGLLFGMKVFATQNLIKRKLGSDREGAEELIFLRLIYNYLSSSIKRNNNFFDIVNGDCLIDVF